jgi:aminopeptidase N
MFTVLTGLRSNPNITIDTKASTTTLVFPRILEASTTAELQIWFRGTIADANDTSALYRQPFTTGNGTVEYLLSTQFEAEDARRVFPCWDEPLFKANFTVTLIIPNNVTAVSNMPIDSEASLVSNGTTKKSVRFKTTPRMSSYLVAWAIGRFQYIESTDYKMPIRVYFAPDQDPAGMRYTLSVATKTMDFFEAKLGVPYPLPKLDFIVHTHQLWGYSGMENWGLITLSSTVVYDMTSSSYSGKQGSTTLTAHEISHLWFGDIVTMTWWDNIWLNEGL